MIEVIEENKPWERQPKETDRAYSYFCTFRDMGPGRSLAKLSVLVNKHLSPLAHLSVKFKWIERVNAWTDELERIKADAVIKELKEMTKRHSNHAQAIENVLMVPVNKFIEKMRSGQVGDIESMPSKELLKLIFGVADLFPKIVDTERKSRGVPTDITQQKIDHTTKGEAVQQLTLWDNLKADIIKKVKDMPEAKKGLLEVLDQHVNSDEPTSGS